MIKNIQQFIYNEVGNLIDSTTDVIRLRNNYTNTIQVLAPFRLETSVKILFKIRGYEDIYVTDIVKPSTDEAGLGLKGYQVVDSNKSYYDIIRDWNVWEVNMRRSTLVELIGADTRSLEFKLYFSDIIIDPVAENYVGTFGSNISDTGRDVPPTANKGDYYKLDLTLYESRRYHEILQYGDILAWNGTEWVKASKDQEIAGTSYRALPVERYKEEIHPDAKFDIEDELLATIAKAEGQITKKINEAPKDGDLYGRRDGSWYSLDGDIGWRILDALNVHGDLEYEDIVFPDLFHIDGGDVE